MNETIFDVVSHVADAYPQYKRNSYNVVARIHGEFDGKEDTYWLIVDALMKLPWEHGKTKVNKNQ